TGVERGAVADVLAGKGPARAGGCAPPFYLACEVPSAAVRRVRVCVERGEGVLEHGQHETLLGLEGEGRAAKELRREHGLRFEVAQVVPHHDSHRLERANPAFG